MADGVFTSAELMGDKRLVFNKRVVQNRNYIPLKLLIYKR